MTTLYMLIMAIETTLGFMLVIPAFLISKERRKWGLIWFGIAFTAHDFFMMRFAESSSVVVKSLEFILAYVILYLIVRMFFQGSSVKNFIWIYGANFIFQAIGTILTCVIMGITCNFDLQKIEQMGDAPSVLNSIILAVVVVCGGISSREIIGMLLERNNRVIQAVISLAAAVSIAAGAINSVESIFIIIPMLIIALVAGMIHQDRILREVEKQERYYHQLEERQKIRQEELSKIRHDLANHIHVIESVESSQYAREVLKSIDSQIRSGEPIIDCLLDEKERRCNEKEICMQEDIICLTGSRVANFDWVGLLANTLDNAIEACERSEENKTISLDIKRNRDYAVITVTNSKGREYLPIENKFMTTKEKKQEHGYGTKIMKDIVDKYQGRIRYEDLGNQFITHISLKAW